MYSGNGAHPSVSFTNCWFSLLVVLAIGNLAAMLYTALYRSGYKHPTVFEQQWSRARQILLQAPVLPLVLSLFCSYGFWYMSDAVYYFLEDLLAMQSAATLQAIRVIMQGTRLRLVMQAFAIPLVISLHRITSGSSWVVPYYSYVVFVDVGRWTWVWAVGYFRSRIVQGIDSIFQHSGIFRGPGVEIHPSQFVAWAVLAMLPYYVLVPLGIYLADKLLTRFGRRLTLPGPEPDLESAAGSQKLHVASSALRVTAPLALLYLSVWVTDTQMSSDDYLGNLSLSLTCLVYFGGVQLLGALVAARLFAAGYYKWQWSVFVATSAPVALLASIRQIKDAGALDFVVLLHIRDDVLTAGSLAVLGAYLYLLFGIWRTRQVSLGAQDFE